MGTASAKHGRFVQIRASDNLCVRIMLLLVACFGFESDSKYHVLQRITPQRTADQSAYLDPPPGFPKPVGKAQTNSPDDVLASNFGRKLHVDDAPSGVYTVAQ